MYKMYKIKDIKYSHILNSLIKKKFLIIHNVFVYFLMKGSYRLVIKLN